VYTSEKASSLKPQSAVRAVPMAIAYSDQASRGDGPQTARGQRTRSAVLAAARRTFEDRGYVDTRVVDITRRAKVSYGSFYTYFPSKEAVFAEVVQGMVEDFRATVRSEPAPGSTPGDLIARTNRGYLRAYRQNAAMMAILEQAATFNADLLAIRREARSTWIKSASRAIRQWQDEGLVSPWIDPYYAASALGSMVDRSAYVWLVLREPYDEDTAVDQLTALYCGALGLAYAPRVPAHTAT
jgi:AcrR family transcriptional regulator